MGDARLIEYFEADRLEFSFGGWAPVYVRWDPEVARRFA